MKNSVKVGTVSGIGIFLHWTFGLLIAGLFAFYLIQGNDLQAALVGVGLILAVFGCVVLHELGHALTARRFDVPTRDITLYPIGGVARLQRIPEEPMQEFWIAIAGPAVNVVIAGVLYVLLLALGEPVTPDVVLSTDGANFLTTLMWVNLILVGFNLLPAFPMDGGRVLRALLATRLDYPRATQIAAGVGQFMAILFGFVGLIGFNPILLFIALFVYIGAQQEARQALLRTVTEGLPVRQAMMTRFRTLHPSDTLDVALAALIEGAQHDFPVADETKIYGVLTRKDLIKTIGQVNRSQPVVELITEPCFTVEANSMLDATLTRMQTSGCSAVPVLHRGQLVGLLTLENVGELMMISSALRRTGQTSELESVLTTNLFAKI